jgi:hypothetical protein
MRREVCDRQLQLPGDGNLLPVDCRSHPVRAELVEALPSFAELKN